MIPSAKKVWNDLKRGTARGSKGSRYPVGSRVGTALAAESVRAPYDGADPRWPKSACLRVADAPPASDRRECIVWA